MYLIQIAADVTHIIAIIGLLGFVCWNKTSVGISARTQILFALTFVSRYLDLFTNFVSLYNSCMKIFFIGITCFTIFCVYFNSQNKDKELHDTFRLVPLIFGAAIIAFFVNYQFTVLEVLWAFSRYLEAVAIIPQLHMISKIGKSENVMKYYIYGLTQYRVLYIMLWMYRYYNENRYDLISIVPGTIQLLIYLDYFFGLLSVHIFSKYQKCATTDPYGIQPVYVISSNDLPPKKIQEKSSGIENI